MPALAAQGSSAGGAALAALIWAGIILAYWAPSIVLAFRHGRVPSPGAVIVINALLGWTFVGWVVALAMACRSHPRVPWPYPQQPPPYRQYR